MDCVARSGSADGPVRPKDDERRTAIEYLRAASDSGAGRKRESLLRRAANLILPRKRRRAKKAGESIKRG